MFLARYATIALMLEASCGRNALPFRGEQLDGAVGVCGGVSSHPSVLAQLPVSPREIATDAVFVYFTVFGDGPYQVAKASKADGLVTPLVMGTGHPRDIAVAGGFVYWTDDVAGTVNRVGVDGGAVEALVTGHLGAEGLALDATSIYWTDAMIAEGSVSRVALGGGTVQTLALHQRQPVAIAVDESGLCWINLTGGA